MNRKLIFGAVVFGAVALVLFLLRPKDDGLHVTPAPDGHARQNPARERSTVGQEEARVASEQRLREEDAEASARFARLVEIVPLGPSPTTLTPEALRQALASNELRFHQCVRAAGGYDAMRQAMREARRANDPEYDPDAGPRQLRPQRSTPPIGAPATSSSGPSSDGAPEVRREVRGRGTSFDVRPDGTVDPSSIRMSPPVPEPFGACFVGHVQSLHLSGVGEQGVHIDMPMPGPRRPMPQAAGADGGV